MFTLRCQLTNSFVSVSRPQSSLGAMLGRRKGALGPGRFRSPFVESTVAAQQRELLYFDRTLRKLRKPVARVLDRMVYCRRDRRE